MPKAIRNQYHKHLNYEKLMEAHLKSRKGKGMHRAALYVQDTMKHCRRIWGEYYVKEKKD